MNLVIPKPSELNRLFWDKYEEGPKKVATDTFYKIALDLNLIKVKDIAKNISFNGETEYGDLEITINLSKPEKTKKKLSKQRNRRISIILPTVFALKTWATMVVSTGQVALTTVLSEWNLAESLGGITILHMLIILSMPSSCLKT